MSTTLSDSKNNDSIQYTTHSLLLFLDALRHLHASESLIRVDKLSQTIRIHFLPLMRPRACSVSITSPFKSCKRQ